MDTIFDLRGLLKSIGMADHVRVVRMEENGQDVFQKMWI